jgi:hypothetical protein
MVRAKLKRGEAVYGMMITEFASPAVPVILAEVQCRHDEAVKLFRRVNQFGN